MTTDLRGTLTVKPLCAKLFRDLDALGSLDPYCSVKVGGQTQRSVVASGSSKFPSWSDSLILKVRGEDTITVGVWDKDSTFTDELVGEATFPLSRLGSSLKFEDWVDLENSGRPAGQIRLSIQFDSDDISNLKAANATSACGKHPTGFPPNEYIPSPLGYPQQPFYTPGYLPAGYPATGPASSYPPYVYPPLQYPQTAYSQYPPYQASYPPGPYLPSQYLPASYPPAPYSGQYPPGAYPGY